MAGRKPRIPAAPEGGELVEGRPRVSVADFPQEAGSTCSAARSTFPKLMLLRLVIQVVEVSV